MYILRAAGRGHNRYVIRSGEYSFLYGSRREEASRFVTIEDAQAALRARNAAFPDLDHSFDIICAEEDRK